MSYHKDGQPKAGSVEEHQHVYEFFLFVDPLAPASLEAEKEFLDFVQESKAKIFFRLIAFHDFQSTKAYCIRQGLSARSVKTHNEVYSLMYAICLAYKAALMQGKKRGRHFLLNLQHMLGECNEGFSREAFVECARKAKLDLDMFLEDIHGDRAKRDYLDDICLARKMNIITTPSLVVFDNYNYQYGLKFDQGLSREQLDQLILDMANSSDDLLTRPDQTKHRSYAQNNIHLLEK